MAAVNWDKEDNFNKRPCEITHSYLNALIAAINSCGVCFQVWEKKMPMAAEVEHLISQV